MYIFTEIQFPLKREEALKGTVYMEIQGLRNDEMLLLWLFMKLSFTHLPISLAMAACFSPQNLALLSI